MAEFPMNDITSLIGSLGFPIFCCVYMMKSNSRAVNTMNETLNRMDKTLTELTNTNHSMVELITHFLSGTKGSEV